MRTPLAAGWSRHLGRVCSIARWTTSLRSTRAKASDGRDRLNSWIRVSASIPLRVAASISLSPLTSSLDFSRSAFLSRSCVRPRIPASTLLKMCPTPLAIVSSACIFSSTGTRPDMVASWSYWVCSSSSRRRSRCISCSSTRVISRTTSTGDFLRRTSLMTSTGTSSNTSLMISTGTSRTTSLMTSTGTSLTTSRITSRITSTGTSTGTSRDSTSFDGVHRG